MVIWETIFFWLFSLGAVVSSALVIWLRTPLYSAIALILDFFFFAGLYVLLSAHFMAIIQVLVYGGAIMVLFMFIIMLLNLREETSSIEFRVHHGLAALVSLSIFAFMATGIMALSDQAGIKEVRASMGDATQIATPSRVPGLYADLNEEGLQSKFDAKVQSFADGSATPADGKYRPFPGAKFDVPPMMKGGEVNGRPVESADFGTVEPMSLLLVNRFVVPFELTALLLLGAIIGAVIIAKKRL